MTATPSYGGFSYIGINGLISHVMGNFASFGRFYVTTRKHALISIRTDTPIRLKYCAFREFRPVIANLLLLTLINYSIANMKHEQD